MNTKTKLTPLMQQYYDIKQHYTETLILFQVGDFYELFFDDAKKAAAYLGIALTKRGKINGEPIPLCGVPVHAKDHYMNKLVRGGFKVAICDQLEPPRPGSVVKRGVTQVLSPGTLTDEKLLDAKSASYLFSFFPMHNQWGLLFGELLTAQLFATTVPVNAEKMLESELIRFFPDEILLPSGDIAKQFNPFFKKQGYFTTVVDVDDSDMNHWIQAQFSARIQQHITDHNALQHALKTFYAYLNRNQQAALAQFKNIQFYNADDFLLLDGATQRNLELVKNNQDNSRKNTLFAVLDGAMTSMGSRMIKKWLLRPLVKKTAIEQRQNILELFIAQPSLVQQLENSLVTIGDIERVIGRIALCRAVVHDYIALRRALELVPQLKAVLQKFLQLPLINIIFSHIADFSVLTQLLTAAIHDEPNSNWMIKKGFDQNLDHLQDLIENGNRKIIELEQREQQKTGINSLKIRYNKVHGYYIEVTKANMHAVPEHYTQQQTLVGRARFTTPELQQLQHELFTARNEIEQVEKEVFEKIKCEVAGYITQLRKLAHALAHLDALLGLSRVAYNNGYTKPVLNSNGNIVIQNGKHPVVESSHDIAFIPNDTHLTDQESTWIITGPNMGGKSTYLRQVAHIAIMAHIGSFVPAHQANIALLDRIFTRIGASDNVAEGKSTFLVEMEETASICLYATKNSLVILDEVGRGTSTFDGLAIAQAVVEYIYSTIQARCLFATHYHELTHLQEQFPGIASYYAASKKTERGIVFLYKIIRGIADGSFGVEVAKLANLPEAVVKRSEVILGKLTQHENAYAGLLTDKQSSTSEVYQPATEDIYKKLIQENKKLKAELKKLDEIDYDNLSPKKAFDLLWELKEN